ncbi:ankyrin repeat domain protein [Nitzschia inconspicua]|uniref:Ankyrin repeat domain protein n=1 Tax=Nitzschia inconspicua TaxID=303405 RepID=A0A9K3KV65_9STRA|nr:ankyrin repeat domain protein [Nitzschia inconspicua]
MRQLLPRTSIVLLIWNIVLIQHVRSSSHDSVGTTVDLNVSTDSNSTQVPPPTTYQQYQEEKEKVQQYTALDNASWAILSRNVSSILTQNKQNVYNNFIRDCNLAYYKNDESIQLTENTFCQDNDDVRIEMNTYQPSAVYNYTKQGLWKCDMLFYESHSVIHGRPFPMKGRFYTNCFVHFEIKAPIDDLSTYDPILDIPPYIIPHSYWHKEWQVEGWRAKTVREDAVPILIGRGDVAGIQKVYHDFPNKLHESDSNGWTALHESVRSGKLSILKTLLGFGVDKDLLTAAGISPLHFARYYHGETHDITQYLVSIGAKDIKHPVGANTKQ